MTDLGTLVQSLRTAAESLDVTSDVLTDAAARLDALDKLMLKIEAFAKCGSLQHGGFYCGECDAEWPTHAADCWLRDLLALKGEK